LVWLVRRLRVRAPGAQVLVAPLFAVLYIAPIAEELWIARNFDHLCSADAGVFVNKIVEVEGFYDASAVLPMRFGDLASESVEYYKKGGYRYFEFGLAQPRGRPNKVVHVEKINGVWTPKVLDHPVSRYHYLQTHRGTLVAHKIKKVERAVTDSETGELLARETRYRRGAPWFYVGERRPVMRCPRGDNLDAPRYGSVYKQALKPVPKDA
ncbi:MAG: hypothetical protein PVH25_14140, partial [Burkholderiales bacterium]